MYILSLNRTIKQFLVFYTPVIEYLLLCYTS